MAGRESRNLLMVAIALAVFAAAMVWLLLTPPGSDDGAAAASAASPEAEPAVEPVAEPPPAPRPAAQAAQEPAEPAPAPAVEDEDAIDLFAGPMPDFMAEAHLRVLDKKWLGAPEQRKLYDFGQEHKDDARPQLLLAWDSMNREWDGFAVRLYRMAYRADPRAKQEPSMLRDLLDIASRRDRVEFRETVGIVREAFGEEALPAIDQKLAVLRAANNLEGAARLQRLRDQITSGG